MFKVFIYLYIFLESVLCKTWFWLFAQSGEVGAAVTIAVGIGSWAMSQSVTTEGEKGSSLHREWGGSSGPPCIFSTHRWMSPMPGKDCHHWVRNSSLPSAHSSCPLWPAAPVGRGSCPFFFFFPDSLPFLYPDPTINAKGAPGTWGGSWPPLPKSSACPMWPH